MRQTRKPFITSVFTGSDRGDNGRQGSYQEDGRVLPHFKFNENARMLSVIVHDNLGW